jgi:hypothetical protein
MYFTMDINKTLKNHRLSMALIGLTPQSFKQLLITFTQALIEIQQNKKRTRNIGGGRKGNIKLPEQKLFFILFYLKNYPTFDVCAHIFASSKTSTNEWYLSILPILEKALNRKLSLPQRRIESIEQFYQLFPEVHTVMLDGVERPIERSKKTKTQNKHYSGKKKRHTRKADILTDENKQILLLTPLKHGRIHDKRLADKYSVVEHIPEDVSIFADSGLQGIQKQHNNTYLPIKGTKYHPLTPLTKWWNTQVSSLRVTVEHAIAGMKRFRSFSNVWRGKNGRDDKVSYVVAGLWNFHLSTT